MKYRGASGGFVQVQLSAEECDLLSEGVMDNSPIGEESTSATLANDFRALARVARMSDLTRESER